MAHVLIVDDDPDLSRLIAATLRLHGLDSETAGNGEEALARVADRVPDAVLTDVAMPVMDGLTLTRELRARGHVALPVVVYTAQSPDAVTRQARTLGVAAVFFKPASLREVAATVARLTRNGPAAAEAGEMEANCG